MVQYNDFDDMMVAETISKNGAILKSHTSKKTKIRLMKRIFIVTCVMFLSCAAFGQQIRSKNAELNELLTLLRPAGYDILGFDVSDMLNEHYDIIFISKEYDKSGEIGSKTLNFIPVSNKILLTDFPESQRQKVIDEGRIIDPKTNAIAHVKKISFGFRPAIVDSIVPMQIQTSDFGQMTSYINLRGLSVKNSPKRVFEYNRRPFKIGTFKEGVFIPLILYGSVWYDERIDAFRFCGEREIDPDMSAEILKDVPHYYSIGVIFNKKQ